MSTLRTITDFKSKLAGGGTRSNLFEVQIPSFPGLVTGWDADTFSFLCKSAALPASNIGSVDLPFRGRILKVAGDRTFDPWIVTIINDENFKLRTAFEQWANIMNKLDNATGVTNPNSYMTNAFVHQLGRGGSALKESTSIDNRPNGGPTKPLRTYKFYDIFPTNVGQIDLSYDSSDEIETYPVEFQVQYWTAESTDQTGTAIN
jgi:hypothetical protein